MKFDSSLRETKISAEQARWSLLQIFGCRRTHERLLEQLAKLAVTDADILITGPAWVAKEPYAEYVHRGSGRAVAAFVSVNCSTIRDESFEDVLFGRDEEVVTGAQPFEGLVTAAEGGTLFLDEVHSLSPPSQVKLLRFSEEKEYRCLGGIHLRRADVRIMAASDTDMVEAVEANRFREELLLRFRVMPIQVPSIWKRLRDLLVTVMCDFLQLLG